MSKNPHCFQARQEMIEREIDIPTANGRMDAFVIHPDEGGPFPAVVVLMDIWGLREELYDVARKIAVVGYHVTLPNFWYRRGKVRYEFRDEKGRMKLPAFLLTARKSH